jgi:hypothetical protein
MLAAASGKDTVRLVDLSGARPERTIAVPKIEFSQSIAAGPVVDVALSPDGRLVAAARGQVAYVWDAGTGRELLRLAPKPDGQADDGSPKFTAGHANAISAVRFSPNNQALLTSGADESVRMWDLKSGKQLRCYERAEDAQFALGAYDAFDISPDGRWIAATRYAPSQVVIWDALTGKVARSIDYKHCLAFPYGGNACTLASLDFSPDSKSLLTAGFDRTARLWDRASGNLTGLMRQPEPLRWAEFSPDGRRAVTAMGLSDFIPDAGTPPATGGSRRPDTAAWVWDLGHKNVALAARAELLAQQGRERASKGDFSGARQLLQQAATANPDRAYPVPRPDDWRQLCWWGAVTGKAASVLADCDRAVPMDGQDPSLRDTRALARALAGDKKGAIEDLTYVTEHWNDREGLMYMFGALEERQAWLAGLKAGKNPFDRATLQKMIQADQVTQSW